MAQWTERRPPEDFYRVLDPDGNTVRTPPDLSDETLLRIYRTFVRTRVLQTKVQRMQRRGEISIEASTRGEEAIPIGAAAALAAGDWCFPTYRQAPAGLYWGARMDRALAGLMGSEPETVDEHLPLEGSPAVNFSPSYVPLAVNVTNAVGSAMVDRFTGDETVTLAFVGDGSTSEGDFHEALNFAGVFEAPLVTVCHNNQWAISVPAHRQTAAETFAQKAVAHGIPHDRVDGNDVLAMYEKTKEAVDRARAGDGPTFIEGVTYRVVDHNSADAAVVYRGDEEAEYWRERDPLSRFETYLTERGLLDDERVDRIEADQEAAVGKAVEAARSVPPSHPSRMFDNHLHGEGWSTRHQRAELERELAGENPFTDFTGAGFE